jgi:phosphoribosylformylglycinamidine synthase
VSGNVSLYNETKNEDGTSTAILPTPAIGGVGLLEDWERSATIGLKAEGQTIWLIGATSADRDAAVLGQSLWLRDVMVRQEGQVPAVDLTAERRAGELIRQLISDGIVNAVHDVSDGGLLIAIAEMALASSMGATLIKDQPTAFWFGEAQGRYVVTASPDQPLPITAMAAGVLAVPVGRTAGDMIVIGDAKAPLADLRAAHEGFFPRLMGSELTPEF